MDVTDMIRNAEAELRQAELNDENAEAEVQRAEAARAGTQAEVARMKGVLDWLHQQKLSESPDRTATPPPSPAPDRPAATMNQSELCLWVLEQSGHPMTTTEIRKSLEHVGYSYNQMQVRSALKYLGRKTPPRVKGEDGAWQLPRTDMPTSFPPAAATDTPALNGARGEP